VALDRVLAAQPHNAEALFLKGRLTLDSDSGKALVLLRQALEFAPGNPRYGVFLAQILVEQGRPGEAAQILRSVQKNHPALPFLEDLDSLGLPEGGELVFDGRMEHTTSSPESGEACSMCAFTMADAFSNAHLEDPWRLRMRIYYFKKSPAEIEAFYSARIPGFRLIEEKEKQQGKPGSGEKRDRAYAQFVQIKSGGIKPVSNSSELPGLAEAKDGINIVLLDINDHPHLKRKLAPGEHICYLMLTNLRK
jgi:tetratricopeptide (TPR) repeat protein